MKLTIRAKVEVNDKWAENLSMEEIRERVELTLNVPRFPIEGASRVKILLPTTPHSADYRA